MGLMLEETVWNKGKQAQETRTGCEESLVYGLFSARKSWNSSVLGHLKVDEGIGNALVESILWGVNTRLDLTLPLITPILPCQP